jgi:hypothetical protein
MFGMDGGRSENDDAIATADELFRVALMAVGQASELVLRARMEQERRLLAQARADQAHARTVQIAERDTARAVYLAPQQESWWTNATVEDVARAWSTAKAWSRYDPQAVHAQEAIAKTVTRRWGVDIEAVAAGGRTEPGSTRVRASDAAADAVAAVDDVIAAEERQRERDARPATERQMAYIRDRGLDPGHPLTVGEAGAILTEFEASRRTGDSDRAAVLDAEAQQLFDAEGTQLRIAEVEQGGTHPGSGAVEIHQETVDRLDTQGRAVAGAAAEANTAAEPHPPIPHQAAKAKQTTAPGYPLTPDVAVRMGPGRAKPKLSTGTDVAPSRDKGRSR